MTITATPKRTVAAQVKQRAKDRICLVCDSPAEKRGLCSRHYMAFRREQEKRPEGDRAEFETNAIREGKILEVGRIRRVKSDNPFAEL